MIRKIIEMLADRIYPGELYCLCCGKAIDWTRPYGLCDNCMNNMKWATGRLCDKCGKILSPNNPDDTCYNCRANEHRFNHGFTCTEYGAHDRSLVYSLKYDEKPAIARTVGEIMADRMLSEFTPDELQSRYDLLVPVPISQERLELRGYNQAALIADYFARKTGLHFGGEILKRDEDTVAMKGLTPAERRLNLRGRFSLMDGRRTLVQNASCLIVDDIVTTGATVDEVAEVLYASGAKQVDFVSFASGADVVKS